MTLQFFLSNKTIYEQLISHTEEIIQLYDDLINTTFEYYNSFEENDKPINVLCDVENFVTQKNTYKMQKEKMIELKNHNKKVAQNICFHEFYKDYIDINADKSQQIEYCIKCEYTKSK